MPFRAPSSNAMKNQGQGRSIRPASTRAGYSTIVSHENVTCALRFDRQSFAGRFLLKTQRHSREERHDAARFADPRSLAGHEHGLRPATEGGSTAGDIEHEAGRLERLAGAFGLSA